MTSWVKTQLGEKRIKIRSQFPNLPIENLSSPIVAVPAALKSIPEHNDSPEEETQIVEHVAESPLPPHYPRFR